MRLILSSNDAIPIPPPGALKPPTPAPRPLGVTEEVSEAGVVPVDEEGKLNAAM